MSEPPRRTAGARFSATDGAAIAICAASVWGLWSPLGPDLRWAVWIFPVALGHFFLFCNVFRVRRRYELMWTAAFLINFCAWFFAGSFTWLGVLGVQTPITLLAIGAEVRSREYHGIFSRRWNPHLHEYLEGPAAGFLTEDH